MKKVQDQFFMPQVLGEGVNFGFGLCVYMQQTLTVFVVFKFCRQVLSIFE